RSQEAAHVGDCAGDCRRSSRERGREEGAATPALTTLEVSVARAHGVLSRLDLIAVHGDAHRAAGFTPLGARFAEDAVGPFCLRLTLDGLRPGYDERSHAGRNAAALEDACRRSKIRDARVRARTDEDDVDRAADHRRPRREIHVLEGAL